MSLWCQADVTGLQSSFACQSSEEGSLSLLEKLIRSVCVANNMDYLYHLTVTTIKPASFLAHNNYKGYFLTGVRLSVKDYSFVTTYYWLLALFHLNLTQIDQDPSFALNIINSEYLGCNQVIKCIVKIVEYSKYTAALKLFNLPPNN